MERGVHAERQAGYRRSAAWNGAIPAGSLVTFGMNGSYTGTFQPPYDFRLINGQPCEVTVYPPAV